MTEDFGRMIDIRHGRDAESLNLSFWPGSVPLKQRWRNNGLSADFLGDYVTTFFPLDDNVPETRLRQAEIRGAVSFIANELLENAMKYHDPALPEPVTIQLGLDSEQIIFHAGNGIDEQAAETFRTFIAHLLDGDPGELYLQQLEGNALSGQSSGLGYLTMINDYGAELAWRFHRGDSGGYRVIAQVRVKL